MSHLDSALSRRQWIKATSLAAGAAALTPALHAQAPRDSVPADYKIQRNRIRQSVMGWCFKPMSAVELAKHCRSMGIVAIEGISPDDYPAVREQGLEISLVSSHGFQKGPFSREHHAFCIEKLREGIDLAVKFGAPSVITFTGMREPGISDEQGIQNCLDCWRKVLPYAEEKQITLCVEHLNSRDDSHPMKGHPGYFGDDVELVVDLVRKLDSPRFKLLFDVYHVQIMNGDVIRRIRQYHQWIGHYHTAGVPGRAELDETQEVNYPAVMRAIVETGYQGFVAQEFIPTWPDPVQALRHAAMVCDV